MCRLLDYVEIFTTGLSCPLPALELLVLWWITQGWDKGWAREAAAQGAVVGGQLVRGSSRRVTLPPCSPSHWASSVEGLSRSGFFWTMLGTLNRVTVLHIGYLSLNNGCTLLDSLNVNVHHFGQC